MTTSLASLLVQQTKTQIYEYALSIATDLGLPVTSWQAGDPTRSLYHLESELLATLETVVVGFISSGFNEPPLDPLVMNDVGKMFISPIDTLASAKAAAAVCC